MLGKLGADARCFRMSREGAINIDGAVDGRDVHGELSDGHSHPFTVAMCDSCRSQVPLLPIVPKFLSFQSELGDLTG